MGVITSRKIAKMCETNMIAKALAEDTEPHYTTISNFVSGMNGEIEKVFSKALMVCNEDTETNIKDFFCNLNKQHTCHRTICAAPEFNSAGRFRLSRFISPHFAVAGLVCKALIRNRKTSAT
ncbi:MAG: hypothetical protein FWD82_06945 [Defluviitaleaceae bacterium]|nr:hypothetical protein [Defluviitaleaceae bacterium]